VDPGPPNRSNRGWKFKAVKIYDLKIVVMGFVFAVVIFVVSAVSVWVRIPVERSVVAVIVFSAFIGILFLLWLKSLKE
jgi:hypothetical protein